MDDLEFRVAGPDDWPQIWPLIQGVVVTGDTYVYAPDITEAEARGTWMAEANSVYIAVSGGEVVATAYCKPNMPGLGDHVANAGWMVAPAHQGRGVGRAFAEYVLDRAREQGFEAMQFNAVVSTNTNAIALWRSLGFEIVGTVPDAFRHPTGRVAVHVMYRTL